MINKHPSDVNLAMTSVPASVVVACYKGLSREDLVQRRRAVEERVAAVYGTPNVMSFSNGFTVELPYENGMFIVPKAMLRGYTLLTSAYEYGGDYGNGLQEAVIVCGIHGQRLKPFWCVGEGRLLQHPCGITAKFMMGFPNFAIVTAGSDDHYQIDLVNRMESKPTSHGDIHVTLAQTRWYSGTGIPIKLAAHPIGQRVMLVARQKAGQSQFDMPSYADLRHFQKAKA